MELFSGLFLCLTVFGAGLSLAGFLGFLGVAPAAETGGGRGLDSGGRESAGPESGSGEGAGSEGPGRGSRLLLGLAHFALGAGPTGQIGTALGLGLGWGLPLVLLLGLAALLGLGRGGRPRRPPRPGRGRGG